MLMASATDSHYLKRYNALIEHGYDVVAYGFLRNVALTNAVREDINLLPMIENGNYLKRIGKVFTAVNEIIEKNGNDAIYYATTFDIALVCFVKGVRYIYGISDIVHSGFSPLMRNFFSMLDKKLIERSLCTILTSEGFVSYLKLNSVLLKKCLFIKNKLDKTILDFPRGSGSFKTYQKGIRFGFAGNIRYETTLKLAEIIGKYYPDDSFIFWGNGKSEILARVNALSSKYENIQYMGAFSNPADMAKVYDSIDVMACNYDTTTINERIAEPNKLYECIYFNKPIIATAYTFFGETVEKLGIGLMVDNSESDLKTVVSKFDTDSMITFVRNESSIDSSVLIEDFSDLYKILDNEL